MKTLAALVVALALAFSAGYATTAGVLQDEQNGDRFSGILQDEQNDDRGLVAGVLQDEQNEDRVLDA